MICSRQPFCDINFAAFCVDNHIIVSLHEVLSSKVYYGIQSVKSLETSSFVLELEARREDTFSFVHSRLPPASLNCLTAEGVKSASCLITLPAVGVDMHTGKIEQVCLGVTASGYCAGSAECNLFSACDGE